MGIRLPLPLYLDGSDTNTVSELEGRIKESLGEVPEEAARRRWSQDLPDNVIRSGKEVAGRCAESVRLRDEPVET